MTPEDLAALRAEHESVMSKCQEGRECCPDWCGECGNESSWPWDTVKLLDEIDRLRTAAAGRKKVALATANSLEAHIERLQADNTGYVTALSEIEFQRDEANKAAADLLAKLNRANAGEAKALAENTELRKQLDQFKAMHKADEDSWKFWQAEYDRAVEIRIRAEVERAVRDEIRKADR